MICLESSGTVIIFGDFMWFCATASAYSVLLLITMPRPRRSNLSQLSRNAIRQRNIASQLYDEEREIAREERRVSMEQRRALIRASQTQEQREAARETARLETRNRRAYRTDEQRNNLRIARRNGSSIDLNRAAFLYDCTIDYSLHRLVCIGPMDVVCHHCGAFKFAGETPGLCCLSGKVKLPLLVPPPEPLCSLLYGETLESRHFLANTQKYNVCFQMTSFGAEIIEEHGYNPTFKVIYVKNFIFYDCKKNLECSLLVFCICL